MIGELKLLKFSDDELVDMSDNTIVLFSNCELLNKFSKEFTKIIDDPDTKDVDYFVTEDYLDIKTFLCYKATHIYNINGNQQRIILTVEPTVILTMKDKYDIWFVDENNEGKVQIWSLTDFKGYGDEGMGEYTPEDIYKSVCSGIFGCYGGHKTE